MRLIALLVGLVVLGTAASAHAASKYKVRVDSAPQGATVYIDKKENGAVGITPWAGSLTKGTHTIIVEMEGYLPATKTVKVARTRKVQDFFIPLVKKADPPRIDVRADADKNVFGATVYLDGQPQGQAPTLLTTDPGRHQIELKKEGFQDFSQWIEIKENEKVTVNPYLKEIAKPKVGTIVVSSDVDDAEVYLDGNLIGTTPLVQNDVVEGLHVVEVRKSPAMPWKQTVQVEAGKQTKVKGELKATIGGQGGAIKVLSNVQGAHVFLDGTDMGAVPVDIKDVKPGEHVIEVKAPKYQTREERVTVNAGSATVLKLDLNAVAKSEAKIKVVSPVPGADVYIDGASVGKVPAEAEVASGEHFVIVKLEGYKTFEQKLRIEAGQTQTVSAELKAVGKLRVLTDPPGATVLINGIPQDKVTPFELNELEVGETVVRVEMAGMLAQEKTLPIVGGKTEVLSFKLELVGMSAQELLDQQRGLSSFGARTLPAKRATMDFGLGYPYFAEARINVGGGKVKNFGFDVAPSLRTFGARTEIGLGTRFQLVDNEPFSAGAFGEVHWGGKPLSKSGRSGWTVDYGVAASLTAVTRVTITGRLWMNHWVDKHCPDYDATTMDFAEDATPIAACEAYKDYVAGGMTTPTDLTEKMEELTHNSGTGVFGNDAGYGLNAAVASEISVKQRWNIWVMLEGAPFRSERALFTDTFSAPMYKSDTRLYLRLGTTYKF
jgi:hypothetical protein